MPGPHVQVCNNFHAHKADSFVWQNNLNVTCCISQPPNTTWPFVQASPICIPANSTANGAISPNLADGTYSYNVDCCTNLVPKSVTIP